MNTNIENIPPDTKPLAKSIGPSDIQSHGPSKPSINRDGYIDLVDAEQLVGVSYQTLTWASRNQKLAVERNPDAHGRSIQVQVVNLIVYMINEAPLPSRWVAAPVDLGQIHLRPDCQPRLGAGSQVIRQIEDHIRRGGAIDPIWLLPDEGGQLLLVDGHRRHTAAVNCQLKQIPAIVLNFPIEFAVSIARITNQRHGENLSTREQEVIVRNHFALHPTDWLELESGTLSQAKLARRLQISEATLCRVLKPMRVSHTLPLDTKSLLLLLRPLFDHLNHDQPDDSDSVARVLERVVSAIVSPWDRARKVDIDRRLKLASSALSRSIAPEIRALLDRRGGDRRPSPVKETSCPS